MPAVTREYSGKRAAGNLPNEVTAFIGRRRELVEAKRRLQTGRLVTLIGVGGVGKTRLALRVADQVHRAFEHGVWLADLSALQEPSLLAGYVADALEVRDQSARPPLEVLIDHVHDKHLLLVLDNCEHLLDACAELIAALLRSAPRLHVLATSRHLLELEGEYVLPVPPLTVPRSELPTKDIARNEAVALLVDRASAVAPGFSITSANSETLAQLCRRLDGIPLAIELAAVRLNAISAKEVLDRIDDRFQLLTGGWRAGVPHHQTLQAAFDWSFELCDPKEQRLWARLSVFSAGFDLQAAESVCADEYLPRDEIANTMANLVHKSVLGSDGSGSDMRYRLLETTRQYGRQWLAVFEEESTFRRRHRDFYHDLTSQLSADWFSPREIEWLSRVRQDLPNLRAAIDYCLTEGEQPHTGLVMATNLARGRCWFFIGTLGEGRHWLERTSQASQEPTSHRTLAVALNAWIGLCQGDQEPAVRLLEETTQLAQHHGDTLVAAMHSFVFGAHALLVHGEPRSVRLLTEGRDGFRLAGAAGDAHMASVILGLASAFLQEPHEAAETTRECLADAVAHQADWSISWGLYLVGLAELRGGNLDEAGRLVRESLRLQQKMQDRWGPVWGVEGLAWVVAATDPRFSARLLGAAASMRQQTGVTIAGLLPFQLGHAECEDAVVRLIGQNEHAAAVRQGERLTFDQGIDLALTGALPTQSTAPADSALSKLTRQEQRVAEFIAQGMSNREIASRLVVSRRTVESHVQHILTKLGFTSRSSVATWLTEHRAHPEE